MESNGSMWMLDAVERFIYKGFEELLGTLRN